MRFITSPTEFRSSAALINAVLRAIPKAHRPKDLIEQMEQNTHEYELILQNPTIEDIDAFNAKQARDDGLIKFYMDADCSLVIDINPEYVADITDIITAEIPTFAGVAVTIAGMIMMLGGRFKAMGNSIMKIEGKYRKMHAEAKAKAEAAVGGEAPIAAEAATDVA